MKRHTNEAKQDLPLNLISKQIRKQDCIISQTASLVMWTPTGLNSNVLKTLKNLKKKFAIKNKIKNHLLLF